jgi:subtilisin-like proprotein convertase family protein
VPILARALAVLACCVPLVLPAAAQAGLDLTHVSAQAVPVGGDGDDVISPGDAIQLTETLSTATALSSATGTLFSPTPGVVLEADTAPFSSAPAGGQSVNTRPFEAALASSLSCGANLSFTVAVAATGGQDSVSFVQPTGTAGPPRDHDDVVAHALSDSGATDVPLNVPGADRLKWMEVRIGSLSHPDLSDLELTLVAPDGTESVLAEAGSLHGTTLNQLVDTVFADGGLPITGAFEPYTGRYAPRDSLAALEGKVLNGTWTLRITDTVADGVSGSLGAWGLTASKAYCAGIPKGAFTATPNPALPGDTVEFDGSGSTDKGGSIVEYAWDLDGDGAFDDGATPQVSRTYPVKTSALIRLRVTDDDGLVDVEEQRLPVTMKPVAALGATPASPLTGETIRLDAAGSTDPDGSVVRYQWAVDQSDVPERDTQGVSHLDVSFDRPATYTVAVWVTDDNGAVDKKTLDVVVRNRPPVADVAAPALPLKDRVTTLSAAGSSDPDGTIDKYEWDLDDNGSYETGPLFDATVDHTFTTPGTKTVKVRVTDDKNDTATATETFTVTQAPTVVLNAAPNPVSLRTDVTFDASGSSDPDGPGALTFEWDLENDGTYAAPSAATRTTSWATAGTRTVKVRVTDPSGAATVGSVDVLVRNILPVAALSANPVAPRAGESTLLSAIASDGDGTITRYQWDLDGDGAYEADTGTTAGIATSFANAGNNTVGVRVTDNDGGTGTKTLILGVLPGDDDGGEDPPPDGGDGGGTGTGTGTGTGAGAGSDAGSTPPAVGGDGGTAEQPTQPAGGPAGDPARPFDAWLGGTAIQRTKQVVARGLLLSCRSEVAVWCSVKITVSARDAKKLKLGRKAVTVAKTALPVPEGGVVRTRVKLSAKARKALRGKGGVKLLVRAVAQTSDGREVALSRVVLLRR